MEEAQQGPRINPEGVVDLDQEAEQEQEYILLQSKYVIPTLLFLLGAFVQTYRPLFTYWTFTIFLAEIILGITLACICMGIGVMLTTQIPMIGIIANVINYYFHMPYMISHQLMPIPMN